MYGTKRDVGSGEAPKLISRIKAGNVDVIYCWTRYCAHSDFYSIRAACAQPTSNVRFFAVRSLNKLDAWTSRSESWRTAKNDLIAENPRIERARADSNATREAQTESVEHTGESLDTRRAALEQLEASGDWSAMLQEV